MKIEVEIEGKITLKKALKGVQPRSKAASTKFASVCLSFGITDKITYGTLKVMCAESTVKKPSDSLSPKRLPIKINKKVQFK